MLFNLQSYLKPTFDLIDIPEKKSYEKFLNLSSNELIHPMLFELNKEFFSHNLANSVTCYPYHLTARKKIANHFGIEADELLLVPGSDFTINLILMALNNNKPIILPNPEYYNYKRYAKLNGMDVIETPHPTTECNSSLSDYQNLLANSMPAIVVLSNPNGITGKKLDMSDMHNIARCCQQYKHLLLIDEAYSVFCQLDHSSLLTEFDNILILRTFSKSYGIAGLRFAIVLSQKKMVGYLRKTGIENAVSGITLDYFSFLLHNQETLKQIYTDINTTKSHFAQFISSHFSNWQVYNTATHFLTLDVRNEILAKKIVDFFSEQNIAIKYLGGISDFKTCIRITMADYDTIQKVIFLLKKFKLANKSPHLDI